MAIDIGAAFRAACHLDVAVRKPGNVSIASAGHRMQATQFLASAEAAWQPLCQPGATVGQRIEGAVAATWRAVACNTNLGIVLLCAPLAAAAQHLALPARPADVRAALAAVLAGLTVADAAAAFRAIAMAQPAGLGQAPDHDVHGPATVTLRAAMAAAGERDSIARQYRDGFADLFDRGLAAWRPAAARRGATAQRGSIADARAVQAVYLAWLAGWPDSHIVRKHGPALAHSVMVAAQHWQAKAGSGVVLDDDPAFAEWDASLKRKGLNPGTSADLTVATLMLGALLDRSWHGS